MSSGVVVPSRHIPSKNQDGGFWSEKHWVSRCVDCATYGDFYPSHPNDRAAGERVAREDGWHRTVRGWMCPPCYERRKKSKEKAT